MKKKIMKNNSIFKPYLWALFPFAVLVFFFEIIPLILIVVRSFMPNGGIGFTVEHYIAIFTKRLYLQAVINSTAVSLSSALIGITVAFIGAKAASRSSGWIKTLYMSILNMTSNFAGLPLAFAYIILFGNAGVFVMIGKQYGIAFLENFQLYNLWGLMLTYVYFQIPLATLLLIPAFEALRKEWYEAVSILGGRAHHYWMRVAIPVLMPSLLGTLSILFANAVAAYATAYALLQNNFSLLPIRISEQFAGEIEQHTEFGSALAVVMMLLMIIAIMINGTILKKQQGGNISE